MSMTTDDIKEIKSNLSKMLHNQNIMIAHLLCLSKQAQSPSSSSSPGNTIVTTQGLAKFAPAFQHYIACMSKFMFRGDYDSLQKQLQSNQKATKPSTSTTLTTLTPVPIKRKAELPLEEIGNTGGLKHRRGRPRKPEDGGN
uniref:Uncharacterized protein n=1 Tax=Meloidogyne hapla TaxID=6305 RepID=A0A1I8B255_MELHA